MESFSAKTFYDALKARDVVELPEFHYADNTTSTNDIAKALAREGVPQGAICLAEEQLAGRGRDGAKWLSPRGKGVYASVIIYPRTEASLGGELSVMTGIAVAKAIREETNLPARLKWPNDILINAKKTGGILTECRISDGKIEFAVLGTGINVFHTSDDLKEVRNYPATSLASEGAREPNREKLLASVWIALMREYKNWLNGGFEYLKTEWEKLTAHSVGDVVFAKDATGATIKGFYEGIAPGGTLRVKLEDGALFDIRYPLMD